MDDDDDLFAYLQTMDFPMFDIFLDEIPWQGEGFEVSPTESPPPIAQPTETSTPALQVAAMEDPAVCFLNDQIPPLQDVLPDEYQINGAVVFQDRFPQTQENPNISFFNPNLDRQETDNLMEFEVGNQLLLGEKETKEAPTSTLSDPLGSREGIGFKDFSPVGLPLPIGQPIETPSSALQAAALEEEDPAMCFVKDQLLDVFPRQNQENPALPNSVLNRKEVGKFVGDSFEFGSQELPPHEQELSSSSVSERLQQQVVVSPHSEEAGGKEMAEEEDPVVAPVPAIADGVCVWNWQKGKDNSYTFEELSYRGIEEIEGRVSCKSCRIVYDLPLPLNKEKLDEFPSFLHSLGDPWRRAEALRCKACGEMSLFTVVDRGKDDYVNWFFLFLSKQLSLSTVPQIKRFLVANGVGSPTKGGRPAYLRLIYETFYKLLLA